MQQIKKYFTQVSICLLVLWTYKPTSVLANVISFTCPGLAPMIIGDEMAGDLDFGIPNRVRFEPMCVRPSFSIRGTLIGITNPGISATTILTDLTIEHNGVPLGQVAEELSFRQSFPLIGPRTQSTASLDGMYGATIGAPFISLADISYEPETDQGPLGVINPPPAINTTPAAAPPIMGMLGPVAQGPVDIHFGFLPFRLGTIGDAIILPESAIIKTIGTPKKKHQEKIDLQQNHQGNSKTENRSDINFNSINNTLSFENATIDTVFLNGNIPTFDDPILNGQMIIGDTVLLEPDAENRGWFFQDTSYEVMVDGVTVLTADLVNPFLFDEETVITPEIHGLAENLIFDSEFQAFMDNIVVNNIINSSYLDDLQENIDQGKQRNIAIFSDIVSATNGFTAAGTSEAIVWDDGVKTPEPTSSQGLLSIGIGGLGLTLKRKLKPSQSTEKGRSPS